MNVTNYKGEVMKTTTNAITKVANNKDTRTELYELTVINTNSPYYFTEKTREFFNSKVKDIYVVGKDLNNENLNARYGASVLNDVDYIILIEEKILTNSNFVEYKEYQIIFEPLLRSFGKIRLSYIMYCCDLKFKRASIVDDLKILEVAKEDALEILKDSKTYREDQYKYIYNYLKTVIKERNFD